jgi:hypothetical protein
MDPMLQGQIKEWVLIALFGGFPAYLLYMMAMAVRRKQQNEMRRHLLDKFATAKDFAEFVQTPAGQKYVMSFSDAATSPMDAILGSLRTGVVLLFGGAGLSATVSMLNAPYVWGLGVVLSCLGTGFLVSAGISYWIRKKVKLEANE